MKCLFETCDRPTRSRSARLCDSHYYQQRVGKELSPLRPKAPNGTGRKDHKRRAADYNRKYNYSLTTEEYLTRLVLQDSKCAVCQDDLQSIRICIDHDHKTQQVRGLLCLHCNLGLGQFRDNKDFLLRGAEYLKEKESA